MCYLITLLLTNYQMKKITKTSLLSDLLNCQEDKVDVLIDAINTSWVDFMTIRNKVESDYGVMEYDNFMSVIKELNSK